MKSSSASDGRSQKMSTYKDVLKNIPRKGNTHSIPDNIRHGLFPSINYSQDASRNWLLVGPQEVKLRVYENTATTPPRRAVYMDQSGGDRDEVIVIGSLILD